MNCVASCNGVLNMFQIQLRIIKADFYRSEAVAEVVHCCRPRGHSGGAGGWSPRYGIYIQIRVPPNVQSYKPVHGVVIQLLIIVRSVCWMAPVVFSPFALEGFFTLNRVSPLCFCSCVLRRLSAVIHNKGCEGHKIVAS